VDKSPDAFRTISEVADDLDLPQHVLRFWETRFGQIKPLKRGGGRRYYRPDDVVLLRGIKHLLYGEGYTIKGVQRILREQGLRYVMAVWREDVPQASTLEAPAGHEAYAPRRGARSEPVFDDAEPGPEAYARRNTPLPVERVAQVTGRRPNFEPIIDTPPEEEAEPEEAEVASGEEFSGDRRERLETALRELVEARRILDAGN
jgi:DNA-binding transcriptional MerR regulator